MRAKALQNLRAADLLFERGLLDAAAGRYYYAAFQASVHVLERLEETPSRAEPGARRWGHVLVESRVTEVRGRAEDARFYRALRNLRERADYNAQPILRREVEACRREVDRFVNDATG